MVKNYVWGILTGCLCLLAESIMGQVTVTPASGGTNICVGTTTYSTLGTLTIRETAVTDFPANENNVTYFIDLPSNFEYNTSATLTVTPATVPTNDITAINVAITSTSRITMTYSTDGTANSMDVITIAGIQIRATTAPAFGNITRAGGSANQPSNATGQNNHGTLFSISSPVVSLASSDPDNAICIDAPVTFNAYGASTYEFFRNGGSLGAPSATSSRTFPSNSLTDNDQFYVIGRTGTCATQSSTIQLDVYSLPAAPTLTSPSSFTYTTSDAPILMVGNPGGGVFSGTGVSGSYFDPQVSGAGSFGVTYEVTNAQGCSNSAVVGTFNVSNPATKINNLKTAYCLSDPTNNLSLSAAGLLSIPAGYAFYDFQVIDYFFCLPPFIPCPSPFPTAHTLAGNNFNANTVYNLTGGTGYKNVIIRARNISSPFDIVEAGSQLTRIYDRDVVSFTSVPSAFTCQSAPALALSASPAGGVFTSSPFSGYVVESPPASGNYVLQFSAGTLASHFYPNSMTLTYTYTNPVSGCITPNTTTFSVDKQPAPVGSSPSSPTICRGESPGVLTATGVTTSPAHTVNWYADVAMTSALSFTNTYTPPLLYDTITYYVTQSRFSCYSVPTPVRVNVNAPAIISAGVDKSTCPSKPASLTGVKGGSALAFNTPVTWSKQVGSDGSFNSTSSLTPTFTPGVADNAAGFVMLKITTNDPDGVGGCPAVADSMVLIVNPLPIVNMIYIDSIYCRNQPVVPIYGQHPNSATEIITGPGITGSPAAGYKFSAALAGLGTRTIKCVYTDANGCVDSTQQNLNVYPEPNPDFTISSLCSGRDTTVFTNTTTIVNTPFNTPIASWQWLFDNIVSETQMNSKYFFSNHGVHNIKLKATSSKSCSVTKDSTFIMGPYPDADFSWKSVCFGDSVAFTDLSTISVNPPGPGIALRSWDFDVANTGDPLKNVVNTLAVKYKYPTPGNYNTKLVLTSNIGCKDSVIYPLYVLPYNIPTATQPYHISFADSSGLWAGDGKNSSWEYGVPDPVFKNFNTTIPNATWVTKLNDAYNVGEKSNLNSPCFNFTSLDKPMISIRFRTGTLAQIAGMVLEYSIDGATWQKIGTSGDGINWYNTLGIAGGPGNPSFNPINEGWSGEDTVWRVAKIGLANLTGMNKLRFRLAFGSPSDSAIARKSGVVIDSVWVGNKNKVLLLEHFTNNQTSGATSPANTVANNSMNAIRNTRSNDIAAVYYHASFPDKDPFNQYYQEGPSSRVLYYGVTATPRTVLDGNYYNGNVYTGGTADTRIDLKDVDARSLETAMYTIDMTSTMTPGNVAVATKVTYTGAAPKAQDVVLHTVVIEDDTTGSIKYHAIARRMLPDAAGTYISRTWSNGDSESFSNQWNHSLSAGALLGVVSFLQNVNTKEVYQAAYLRGSGTYGVPVVTGLEDKFADEFNVRMFPNPATDEVFFLYGKATRETSDWAIYDQMGREVERGICSAGKEGFSVNTSRYAGGIYHVKIKGEKGAVEYKELVVIH